MKHDGYILITNDDGFGVEGISAVVHAVRGLGPAMVIVPQKNQSGLSHRITMRERIVVREVPSAWPWVKKVFVVNGTPADCVRLGVFSLSRHPVRLVVSGANHGANMGEDVVYSGTVAAAREGAMLGIPSMSVSVASKVIHNTSAVTQVTRACTTWIMKSTWQKGVFFNINMPKKIKFKSARFSFTRLGKRIYNTKYVSRKKKNQRSFLLKEHVSGLAIPGTDIYAVSKGNISVTPLTLDFTNGQVLKKIKNDHCGISLKTTRDRDICG